MEVDTAILNWKIGASFKFHSNLLFKYNKTKFFPSFFWEIILNWKKHLAMIPSCIVSQHLCYNKSIQVDKSSVQFFKCSEKIVKYVSQLLGDDGSINGDDGSKMQPIWKLIHIQQIMQIQQAHPR